MNAVAIIEFVLDNALWFLLGAGILWIIYEIFVNWDNFQAELKGGSNMTETAEEIVEEIQNEDSEDKTEEVGEDKEKPKEKPSESMGDALMGNTVAGRELKKKMFG